MERRFLLKIAPAALIAFATSGFAAKPKMLPHDKKAAKREFQKILEWLNKGDLDGVKSYGGLQFIVSDKTLTEPEVAAFVRDFAPDRIKPQFRPVKLGGFDRAKGAPDRAIYYAGMEQYSYVENECFPDSTTDDGGGPTSCTGKPGYQYSIQGWYIGFKGEKIRVLQLLHRIA